jgi:hypothetical protein
MQTIGLHSDSINDFIQNEDQRVERLAKLEQIKNKHQLEKQRSILRRIEQYLHPSFLAKSSVCKHEQGCFENGIRKAFKTFIYGFGLMMIFKVLSMARKPS